MTDLRIKDKRWGEALIQSGLALCAFVSVTTTIVIIFVLGKESLGFFDHVSPLEFLFGTRWVPLFEPSSYGVLPLLWGTLLITFGAAILAIPVGLAAAVYLSEYASQPVRSVAKPTLELLAGNPHGSVRLFCAYFHYSKFAKNLS